MQPVAADFCGLLLIAFWTSGFQNCPLKFFGGNFDSNSLDRLWEFAFPFDGHDVCMSVCWATGDFRSSSFVFLSCSTKWEILTFFFVEIQKLRRLPHVITHLLLAVAGYSRMYWLWNANFIWFCNPWSCSSEVRGQNVIGWPDVCPL